MKILSYNSTRLRNVEHLSLSSDVLNITKTYDWEGANMLKLYTWVKESNVELKNQLNKLSTVNETLSVKQADDAFNNAWRALKHVVKAGLISPIPEERENVAILYELMKAHGINLHEESYQVQNASATIFLKDCKKDEIKAAITTAQIDRHIEYVQNALNSLSEALAYRKGKKLSEMNDIETHEVRSRLTTNMNRLFKYLEVASDISPSVELDTMIKKINLSIQNLEIAIKKRTHKSVEVVD